VFVASFAMQPELPLSELIAFVIEKAPSEMPQRRARLYRALIAIVGDAAIAAELTRLADECDRLESQCRQLVLNFGRGQA
jgi:hypothetical protein